LPFLLSFIHRSTYIMVRRPYSTAPPVRKLYFYPFLQVATFKYLSLMRPFCLYYCPRFAFILPVSLNFPLIFPLPFFFSSPCSYYFLRRHRPLFFLPIQGWTGAYFHDIHAWYIYASFNLHNMQDTQ
jgi:hypothetical protein